MDLHQYWKHKWVSPKIEVRKSPVHGQGSFATAPIQKGEIVSVNGGLVVPVRDAPKLRGMLGSLRGLQVSDDFLLTVTNPEEAMFNHSCEPNLGLSGPIVTVAIRDIVPGEEVFYCYYFSETNFDSFACNCSSVSCRKVVQSPGWNDDLSFQKKYAQYYSPYLQARFTWR